jgi:hypothetical protein
VALVALAASVAVPPTVVLGRRVLGRVLGRVVLVGLGISTRSNRTGHHQLIRKAEARTREALIGAMGKALEAVSAQDARGFFGHCGYCSMGQLL